VSDNIDFAIRVGVVLLAFVLVVAIGIYVRRGQPTGAAPMSDTSFILRVGVVTLAAILLAMVVAMLHGLFVPSVENDKIFAILGPAFQTIVGCFVGMVSGRVIDRLSGAPAANENSAAPPPAPDVREAA
jgi:hypothetical protein